jgi:hypothetical protein
MNVESGFEFFDAQDAGAVAGFSSAKGIDPNGLVAFCLQMPGPEL